MLPQADKDSRLKLAIDLSGSTAVPRDLARRMAEDEIEVASPDPLVKSTKLTDQDLIELAARSPEHAGVIATRRGLSMAVADKLMHSGQVGVIQSLLDNASSQISVAGLHARSGEELRQQVPGLDPAGGRAARGDRRRADGMGRRARPRAADGPLQYPDGGDRAAIRGGRGTAAARHRAVQPGQWHRHRAGAGSCRHAAHRFRPLRRRLQRDPGARPYHGEAGAGCTQAGNRGGCAARGGPARRGRALRAKAKKDLVAKTLAALAQDSHAEPTPSPPPAAEERMENRGVTTFPAAEPEPTAAPLAAAWRRGPARPPASRMTFDPVDMELELINAGDAAGIPPLAMPMAKTDHQAAMTEMELDLELSLDQAPAAPAYSRARAGGDRGGTPGRSRP